MLKSQAKSWSVLSRWTNARARRRARFSSISDLVHPAFVPHNLSTKLPLLLFRQHVIMQSTFQSADAHKEAGCLIPISD